MKTLQYAKSHNLSLLHDELVAAIPSLAPTRDAEGIGTPVMRVEGLDDDIWLTVPDDTDDDAVATVITAHDGSGIQPDPTKEALASGATKLKALGLTDDEIAALQR